MSIANELKIMVVSQETQGNHKNIAATNNQQNQGLSIDKSTEVIRMHHNNLSFWDLETIVT